jgi:hypothetical protein
MLTKTKKELRQPPTKATIEYKVVVDPILRGRDVPCKIKEVTHVDPILHVGNTM